jgi:type I restriction enzyme R subunit
VVLAGRLRQAVAVLNPGVPAAAREDAICQVLDLGTPVLLAANRHSSRRLATPPFQCEFRHALAIPTAPIPSQRRPHP